MKRHQATTADGGGSRLRHQPETTPIQGMRPDTAVMDKVKAYEELKKDLENGELTQKGFDVNVKKLLTADKTDDSSSSANAFISAAQAFGKAKKLLQPQIKKKQFPLSEKRLDRGKSLLKIRLAPMEWKPRTLKKAGRYQKIILEETPPRIILQGHETYEELVTIGKTRFWPEDVEGSDFTLCQSDGSRWSKEDFHKEYKTVSDITHPWKRTLYVGRRELDVMCLDDQSCTSDEFPENHMDQIVVEQCILHVFHIWMRL
ncbi:uncharacterized protein [Paramormyrops kingsleyae]|uniref:uncharacterized protein isoform X4 n=1 Tax=Paramormyrops kingsleyae TaxID=1676925 RepID=UPI003B975E69